MEIKGERYTLSAIDKLNRYFPLRYKGKIQLHSLESYVIGVICLKILGVRGRHGNKGRTLNVPRYR
jgi:hypothetical protein